MSVKDLSNRFKLSASMFAVLTYSSKYMQKIQTTGKYRALSREVTCYFRLYIEIGKKVLNQFKMLFTYNWQLFSIADLVVKLYLMAHFFL